MVVRPTKVAPAATSAATAGAVMVEVEQDEDDDDEDFEFSFLHLLYAGEPNDGSCPATSYISLLANVREDNGRLEEETGGARTAGDSSELLQHAAGALARASFAIIASSSFGDALIRAAAAKLWPLFPRRYPRATAAARRGSGQGSVVATIWESIRFYNFFLFLSMILTVVFSLSSSSPPLLLLRRRRRHHRLLQPRSPSPWPERRKRNK